MKTCSGKFSWVAASNARVAPPPPSRRVTGNCLSSVGCERSYGSLTHDNLAGGEVADAKRFVAGSYCRCRARCTWPRVAPTCARVLVALVVTVDRVVVSGVCSSFISARRRALISERPVSGRKERKTSVLRLKRGRMVAAAG